MTKYIQESKELGIDKYCKSDAQAIKSFEELNAQHKFRSRGHLRTVSPRLYNTLQHRRLLQKLIPITRRQHESDPDDINHTGFYATHTLNRIQEMETCQYNKTKTKEYFQQCKRNGFSNYRIISVQRFIFTLLQSINKRFDEFAEEDIEGYIDSVRDKYSRTSLKAVEINFISFWTTIGLADKIGFLNTKERRKKRHMTIKKDYHRTSEEELKKVLQQCRNARDECLSVLFFETGAREGDLAKLHIRNFDFAKDGELRITIPTSKTENGERKILALISTPYVAKWFSQHPHRTNRDDFAFVGLGQNNYGNPLTNNGIYTMLKRTWERAGVPWSPPHGHRHNRATIASKFMTDRQMNQYFGWSERSNMPATYSHLSGKDTDSGVYSMNGIEKEEFQEATTLLSHLCPRCETINETSLEFCKKCGCVLDLKKAIEIQEEKEKIQNELIVKKMESLFSKIAKSRGVRK